MAKKKEFGIKGPEGFKSVFRIVEFPKTKKAAFKASIRKWEFIVDNHHWGLGNGGQSTCALCHLYFGHHGFHCHGCPVFEDGYDHCVGTPYGEYEENEELENAQAELDYLLDLYKRTYGEEYKP